MSAGTWDAEVELFERAGRRAEHVLAQVAVGVAWEHASVLPRLTVGGLAAHLLGVLRSLEHRLESPAAPGLPVVDLASRYSLVRLERLDDLDQPQFAGVRDLAHDGATRGHVSIAAAYGAALRRLVDRMTTTDPDGLIETAGSDAAVSVRDYTLTRTVELVVHADDLGESVGVSVPPPDAALAGPVVGFLQRSVVERIGRGELLRALAGRRPADALRAL